MLVRQQNVRPAVRIDTGDWTSRRLLLADDGAAYSLHDTVMKAGSNTLLTYSHHVETAYCIEGRGWLEDLADGKDYTLAPGTIYNLSRNDRVRLYAETDLRLICVMTPALTGHERLDHAGAYPLPTDARPPLRRKNIFVVGLTEFSLARLQSIRNAENYNFVTLLERADVDERAHYDIEHILGKARGQLESYPGDIDGLVHHNDFPVSTMMPILCHEFGLPSASLEAVLKCEHKYWSRYEQRRCIPEHIPQFVAFDPFDEGALAKLGLDFPFWVKPIKSYSSYLGFRINNRDDWMHAIKRIRANIGMFKGSFDNFLERADIPAEVARIGGGHCLAESIIGGRMCTQEGFVHKGKLRVYGTVDSIREPGSSSFASYQYPSRLPADVRERMTVVIDTFMTHIGFDNAAFNAEFFWDDQTDAIWLLEVNPRISESHTNLFQKVDGASHHEIATDLSLGQRPRLSYRDGEFPCAGKFFIRTYRDAIVRALPDAKAIKAVAKLFPGTIVKTIPEAGQRLSRLYDQDSYSYTLAIMWIGAGSHAELQQRFETIANMLEFDLEQVATTG